MPQISETCQNLHGVRVSRVRGLGRCMGGVKSAATRMWTCPYPMRMCRREIEGALEQAVDAQKEQRTEAAAARKEARAEMQRARDREIAAILSGCARLCASLGYLLSAHTSSTS